MKTVSLKIDDSVFTETEHILSTLKKSRNRYINEALDYYNKIQERERIEKQLKLESEMVAENSMEVLGEFDDLDYAD